MHWSQSQLGSSEVCWPRLVSSLILKIENHYDIQRLSFLTLWRHIDKLFTLNLTLVKVKWAIETSTCNLGWMSCINFDITSWKKKIVCKLVFDVGGFHQRSFCTAKYWPKVSTAYIFTWLQCQFFPEGVLKVASTLLLQAFFYSESILPHHWAENGEKVSQDEAVVAEDSLPVFLLCITLNCFHKYLISAYSCFLYKSLCPSAQKIIFPGACINMPLRQKCCVLVTSVSQHWYCWSQIYNRKTVKHICSFCGENCWVCLESGCRSE